MENLLGSIENLISAIGSVTGEPKEIIKERLMAEILLLGTNVTRDLDRLGIKPHFYSAKLESYYNDNDSFLYELIVYQMSRSRQQLTNRYLEIAKSHQESYAKPCSVLCLGEGIGVDALAFLQNGFEVTYFDFPCKSYDFAQILWSEYGVKPTVINELSLIPKGAYDIVLNTDVLEHVQHPDEVIKNISDYLRDNGIAMILASYQAIQPNLSTHLFANLEYWGQTVSLFAKNSMVVTNFSDAKGVPFVFKKYEKKAVFRNQWVASFFDKVCMMVRIQEFLTQKIRRVRVIAKFKDVIQTPDYMSDVVSGNPSPLLKFKKM